MGNRSPRGARAIHRSVRGGGALCRLRGACAGVRAVGDAPVVLGAAVQFANRTRYAQMGRRTHER